MSEMTPDEPMDDNSQNVDQLQPDDTLEDRGVDDVLDEGISPPEAYRGEGFGTTAEEAREGESFDERLRQEVPDEDPADAEGENVGGEVGTERAGRLVDPDEGLGEDEEKDLVGDDIGIDGAGASAEEAAVHVIE